MSDAKPRILLTGANGTLGRAIRAEGQGQFTFVGVDIATGGDPDLHEGSFTDRTLMERLIPGCDVVIHTAALHGGNRYTHTPTQFTEVNVGGQVTLLELCVKYGVKRFVFSSTLEVLIGVDWLSSGLSVVDERTTPNPDWIYPLNKLLCEQCGLYYHQNYGLEFIAMRYMWFDAAIPPNPLLLSRYIMPADVARANLLAATKPGIGHEILNIGPETPLTQSDIVQAMDDPVAVAQKYWPGAVDVLERNGIVLVREQFWPVTRIDRAKRVLGWKPEVTFETFLRSLGWQRPVEKSSLVRKEN